MDVCGTLPGAAWRVPGGCSELGTADSARGGSSSGRPAFTLLEILVVLGILIAIAAMVAPSVVSRMRENKVAQAAESVRDTIARSRTYAIDTGIDYQFRYEPNGRYFVVLPSELEPAVTNSTMGDAGESDYLRLSGELAEGFRLNAPEGSDETAESLDAAWFGQLPNALQLSQVTWSAPTLFHFDGSASDASFRVSTDEKLTADLSVRGLTGAISVSTVYREQD